MDRALFVLVDFTDTRNPTLTRDAVQQFCDGVLRDYLAEVSYGQCDHVCDVVGWHTLDMTADQCADMGRAREWQQLADAVVALLDPTTDFSVYRHVVIFAPWTYNGYGGMELACQLHLPNGTTMTFPVAFVQDRNSLASSRSYPTYDLNAQSAVRHEILHTYHMSHDDALICPAGGPALPPGGLGSCNIALYGNVYSAMGRSDGVGHPSAENKARAGWLVPPYLLDLTGTVDTVTLTLAPLETNTENIRAIKCRRSLSSTFYVEFRQPIGSDARLVGPDAFNGVLISMQDYYGNPALIDTSPSYIAGTHTGVDLTFNSVALLPGQTFTDEATGFRVECHSVGPEGAAITVTPATADLSAPLAIMTSPIYDPPKVYPYASVIVSGMVPFAAQAAGDVAEVIYHVGSIRIATTAPFAALWDSTKVQNASYPTYAEAFDAAGNKSQTPSIVVTVQNEVIVMQPPPPPPPPPPQVVVTITSPSVTSARAGSTLQLAATTDPPTPVTWSANKGSIAGSSWTLPRQPNQSCTITALAGNGSASKTILTRK